MNLKQIRKLLLRLVNEKQNKISKNSILKYKNHVLNKFHRQALHAFKLIFVHPTQKDLLKFELPVADDIRILIENLEKL